MIAKREDLCYNVGMKNVKKKSAAVLAAAASLMLTACSTTPTPTFDSTRPWHDTGTSYEKLVYGISVYDTANGEGDNERVKIADGEVTFILDENVDTNDVMRHTKLNMSMSVTYNDKAPEVDRGCVDTITSEVEWQTESLATARSTKTVTLAPRAGEAQNLSYTVSADYFGDKKATREMYGETAVLDIPGGQYYDNEMLFYMARASSISDNSSLPFYMTNLFDCFLTGEFSTYTMSVSVAESRVNENVGDWVAEFGIEKVTAEDGGESYPIQCFDTSIGINADRHGPPYYVTYSAVPFKKGDKEHKKLPIRIRYDSYTGGNLMRMTEYVLKDCAFEDSSAN